MCLIVGEINWYVMMEAATIRLCSILKSEMIQLIGTLMTTQRFQNRIYILESESLGPCWQAEKQGFIAMIRDSTHILHQSWCVLIWNYDFKWLWDDTWIICYVHEDVIWMMCYWNNHWMDCSVYQCLSVFYVVFWCEFSDLIIKLFFL